mmetsp:Transcript_4687/g.14138  ORF Transcript_4687/g.14138 Transcript_4687/m.14138 type:complete len:305 (-) Transcript_4687:1758-2672(-)
MVLIEPARYGLPQHSRRDARVRLQTIGRHRGGRRYCQRFGPPSERVPIVDEAVAVSLRHNALKPLGSGYLAAVAARNVDGLLDDGPLQGHHAVAEAPPKVSHAKRVDRGRWVGDLEPQLGRKRAHNHVAVACPSDPGVHGAVGRHHVRVIDHGAHSGHQRFERVKLAGLVALLEAAGLERPAASVHMGVGRAHPKAKPHEGVAGERLAHCLRSDEQDQDGWLLARAPLDGGHQFFSHRRDRCPELCFPGSHLAIVVPPQLHHVCRSAQRGNKVLVVGDCDHPTICRGRNVGQLLALPVLHVGIG